MKHIWNKFTVFATGYALSLVAIGAAPAQAANIIKNGSFEIGSEPGEFLPLSVGSTDIQDWTVIKGGIDYYGTGWLAADGNRSLDLNGTPGVGGVAQTFSTKDGQQYLVSFDFAGHPSGFLQTMEVAAAGQSELFSFQAGTDPKNIGWHTQSWLFTAIDTETTLEFSSLQTNYEFGGPALDNVSVTAVSVPEPMTIMGSVVAVFFGSLFKRSQSKNKDLA
ncbi:choice-of-anchor C family protein [Coleofasciculus chthonoplastes]|uniref:choice-of-anchor C family protein n=1 Tax=Coleofasciculus chthonoplastes TaxID=64178 RepID=UPI0032F7EA8E